MPKELVSTCFKARRGAKCKLGDLGLQPLLLRVSVILNRDLRNRRGRFSESAIFCTRYSKLSSYQRENRRFSACFETQKCETSIDITNNENYNSKSEDQRTLW